MYERVLLHEAPLTKTDFQRWAQQLGLDEALFQRSLRDPRPLRYLKDNNSRANALNANSVPSIFVNGRLLQGVLSYEVLRAEIQSAIDASGASLVSGVKKSDLIRHQSKQRSPDFVRVMMDRAPVSAKERPRRLRPKDIVRPGPDETPRYVPVNDRDPVVGAKAALVTVVAFLDLSSPLSLKSVPTLKRLLEHRTDSLRVVFKPAGGVRRAGPALFACLAAHEQGRFWEMLDAVVLAQERKKGFDVMEAAKRLNLDMSRYKQDLLRGAERYGRLLEQASMEASAAGAVGAPFFFINGVKLRGSKPLTAFQELIDRQEVNAKRLIRQGVARSSLYETLMLRGRKKEGAPVWSSRQEIRGAGAWPGRGPQGAPIELILFSELTSPQSIRFLRDARALVHRMNGKARLVVKPFPALSDAVERTAGALAWQAYDAGQFWPLIFALEDLQKRRQRRLSEEELKTLKERFAPASDESKAELVSARLKADASEAVRAKVRAAPALFVNGHQYFGQDRTVGGLERAIRSRFLRATKP